MLNEYTNEEMKSRKDDVWVESTKISSIPRSLVVGRQTVFSAEGTGRQWYGIDK